MRLTVLGPNIPRAGASMHVHAEGCQDITRRSIYRQVVAQGNIDTADYADARAVVHSIYPPGDFDYDAETEWTDYQGDIQFFPCTAELPAVAE
jgi:hypothetical protein